MHDLTCLECFGPDRLDREAGVDQDKIAELRRLGKQHDVHFLPGAVDIDRGHIVIDGNYF
jgi:hypothetical protein